MTNPQIQDKTISDISAARITGTLISRVVKDGVTCPALNGVVLDCGDHVRAIGPDGELRRLELLLGPRIADFEEAPSEVASTTLVVTESTIVGRTLTELCFRENYSVNVTRIWRDDFEIIPNATTTLEFGDTIRVVGNQCDCDRLVPVVGHQEERLQETEFTPLALGLLIGVLMGFIAIPLPGGLEVSLGLAGGPLLAGLIAGHFGRIGPLTFRVPLAAKYFIRELGLIFFLAGAGIAAGHEFWAVLQAQGIALLVGGMLTTLLPMTAAFVVARLVLHWDALTAFGAICGAMTSTPGLGAVAKMSRSQASSLAYVAVYPTAMIGITIVAPLLGILLARLMSILA